MKGAIILLKKLKKYGEWYLLLAIPVIGTIVFSIYPLAASVKDSLCNANGSFVGTANYQILFNDTEFRKALVNTLYMGVLGILCNLPLAFVMANMLNKVSRFKSVFKTIFLLPMMMSMVTVALLAKFIFSADPNGLANVVLSLFHLGKCGWFNDPGTSRETLIAMAVWKGLGYNVILFFSGLQTVPVEYYEASRIDGANEWNQWMYITIPSMKNTFIFVYITTAINVLKRFADVYAVSGEFGAPAGSLFTIMLFIYRKTFSTRFSKELGMGAAASIVLFLIILIITAANYLLTEGDEGKTGKWKAKMKRKGGVQK